MRGFGLAVAVMLLVPPVLPARPASAGPSLLLMVGAAPRQVARRHVVQRGETAYRIARRYGVTVEALAAANRLADPARLREGQVLTVPPGLIVQPRLTVPPGRIVTSRPVVVYNDPADDGTLAALVDAGTPLSLGARQGPWVYVSTPGGPAGWARIEDLGPPAPVPSAPDRPAGAAVAEARRLVGVPYVWGGTGDRGVDCSGFVLAVYARLVPNLPRTSFALFRAGTPVEPGGLRPGDLVFFTTYAPGPSHVGIYLGDGQFIHGSSVARRVIVTPMADPYYASRFLGARRLVP